MLATSNGAIGVRAEGSRRAWGERIRAVFAERTEGYGAAGYAANVV